MEGSQQTYNRLIALTEEMFPDIAAQVRDEVSRGKPVSAMVRSAEERAGFQETLSEMKLARITKTDVAVQPYSSDEQLFVLLEALRTLTTSMIASRTAVTELLNGHATTNSSFSFADPYSDQLEVVDNTGLREEIEVLTSINNELSTLLNEARTYEQA